MLCHVMIWYVVSYYVVLHFYSSFAWFLSFRSFKFLYLNIILVFVLHEWMLFFILYVYFSLLCLIYIILNINSIMPCMSLGVPILMSQNIYELMSDEGKEHCRRVDKVWGTFFKKNLLSSIIIIVLSVSTLIFFFSKPKFFFLIAFLLIFYFSFHIKPLLFILSHPIPSLHFYFLSFILSFYLSSIIFYLDKFTGIILSISLHCIAFYWISYLSYFII